MPSGVYFYEPKPVDRNGDGIATTREASQNMVGVAMGDTAVYAEDSMLFEMEVPENPVVASLELKKVNETGEPLANAEFTLSTDLDNDGKVDSFATYTTDTNGEAVIEGLMAGKTYQLTETKAPAGYDPITGEIEFTVEQNEDLSLDMIFNLPNGATCNTPEDEQYILTVVNCETPSGGGGGGGGGGRDPKPEPDPDVNIEDEDPPLTEMPEEDVPLADLPEEDVPLAVLPEEEVPLAVLPATGDASVIWMALSALSGAGLFVTRKKRDEV